jgi:hypothetical protein
MTNDFQIARVCLRRSVFFRYTTVLVVALFAASMAEGNQAESADSRVWISQSGLFEVSYKSQQQPITINRMHNWVLHVETAGGQPVVNADITLLGGMPEHDHGLPTSPRMTQYLGNGEYLIEGIRFHMNGSWEIAITISAGGERDIVVILLEL